MMKFYQKLKTLSLILLVLILFSVAGFIFSPDATRAQAVRGRILSSDIKDIEHIEIQGKENFFLVKEAGLWYVESEGERFPALISRIDSFLKEITTTTDMVRVGSSQEVWSRFGLGDEAAKKIIIKRAGGNKLLEAFIGDYATGGNVYLRLGDKKDCYTVKSTFYGYVSDGRKAWLDLRVFKDIPPVSDIEAVSINGSLRYPESTQGESADYNAVFKVSRDAQKNWKINGKDDAPLAPEAVERMIRQIISLEAEDYAKTNDKVQGLTLTLSMGNGTTRTLTISMKADAQARFALQAEASPYAYLVTTWTLRNMLKTPEELFVKP